MDIKNDACLGLRITIDSPRKIESNIHSNISFQKSQRDYHVPCSAQGYTGLPYLGSAFKVDY